MKNEIQQRISREELYVDFVKNAMWPFVAVLVVCLFYSPLTGILKQNIKTLKVGDLEIDVLQGDLPKPSQDVARALASIRGNLFATFLEMGTGMSWCSNPAKTDGFLSAYTKLSSYGLVALTTRGPNLPTCLTSGDKPYAVSLTDLGQRTRGFVYDLVAAEIKPPSS